jgi:hypothetical protein
MRRVLAMALIALALPAAAAAPREVLDAVQRLPPSRALEAPSRAAACAFAPTARHLGRLASNVAWARPEAVVLFADLPGLAPGHRAAMLRPTRELMARAATRARIAEGGITLHGLDLSPLPADAPAPAFLALHVAPPATPPEGCVAQGPR